MKKVLTSLDKLSKWRENAPLVSFIIPVYNTPIRYLRRCLDSVVTQTYRNLEIIIVDDGSTSEVVDVLKEYQVRDPRIQILSGEHQGVSAARNLALKSMHGKWFAFADADDVVCEDFITEAVAIGEENEADLVTGEVQPIYEGTSYSLNEDAITYQIALSDGEKNELVRQMLAGYSLRRTTTPKFHGRGPHARLYSSASRNNLFFDEQLAISEDVIYNYGFMKQSRTLIMAERTWYYYYQYSVSASHAVFLDKFITSLKQIEQLGEDGTFLLDFHARSLFQFVVCVNNAIHSDSNESVVNLLSRVVDMGSKFGAYDSRIRDQYAIKPWIAILVYFAKHQWILPLYSYWKLFITVKQTIKKRSLISSKES